MSLILRAILRLMCTHAVQHSRLLLPDSSNRQKDSIVHKSWVWHEEQVLHSISRALSGC